MTANRQQSPLHRLDLLAGFFFYELGEVSLRNAPALLMGFRSASHTVPLRTRDTELENLRSTCKGLSTVTALKAAAVRYNDDLALAGGGSRRMFRIDERTLAVSPVYDIEPPELKEALAALKIPHVPDAHGTEVAKLDQPMSIQVKVSGEKRRYPIRSLPANLPAPAAHDTGRAPTRRFSVVWEDLLQEAREMDATDERERRVRPGNWFQRLNAVALCCVGANGSFSTEKRLELDGLKHLIGLPGAGKTTLLMCLLRHFGMRGIKAAVFFPSIEVCRQYLAQ